MATAQALYDLVWDRLVAVSEIDAYDAEPPATPPTGEDGRVSAYAVLYATPGALSASSLTGAQQTILGSFQVTCIGGDPSRALGCVDAVRSGVAGPVTIDGVERVIRVSPDDPGLLLADPNWSPPRYYAPVEFQIFAP